MSNVRGLNLGDKNFLICVISVDKNFNIKNEYRRVIRYKNVKLSHVRGLIVGDKNFLISVISCGNFNIKNEYRCVIGYKK